MTSDTLPDFLYSEKTRSVTHGRHAVMLSESEFIIFAQLADGTRKSGIDLAGSDFSLTYVYVVIRRLRGKLEKIGLTLEHDGHRYHITTL